MKDFDIAKYLKEHQLGSYGILNHYVDLKPVKEEVDETPIQSSVNEVARVNKPEIVALLSKFRAPSEDEYEVKLYYYDQPSIPKSYMTHAADVFMAVVEACGGTAQLQGKPSDVQNYIVQGCSYEALEQAWEYLGSDEVYDNLRDDQKSLIAANGAAQTWQIETEGEDLEEEWYPHLTEPDHGEMILKAVEELEAAGISIEEIKAYLETLSAGDMKTLSLE